MNQKTITYWLKAVIFAIGLLGLAFFGGATAYAFLFKPDYNELLPIYLRQNMVFIWITAAICYSILFFFNKIVKRLEMITPSLWKMLRTSNLWQFAEPYSLSSMSYRFSYG